MRFGLHVSEDQRQYRLGNASRLCLGMVRLQHALKAGRQANAAHCWRAAASRSQVASASPAA